MKKEFLVKVILYLFVFAVFIIGLNGILIVVKATNRNVYEVKITCAGNENTLYIERDLIYKCEY